MVLAAGFSRRFGGPKLRHLMPNGQPLIVHSLIPYCQLFEEVVLLHGGDEELLNMVSTSAELSQTKAEIVAVQIDQAHLGMSQSIIAGVNASAAADAWLIGLGDMPYVKLSTIRKLSENLSKDNIVMPYYSGRPGNPVGFGSKFRQQLLTLKGDRGGKAIVQANKELVIKLEVDDEGVLLDVDYPSAIQ